MKIMGGMRILWCTRIIPLQKKLAKFHFHNQVKLRSIKILIGSSQNSSHTLFHFLLLILISFLKNAYLVKHTVIVVLPYLLECNHRNLFFKMGFRWGSIWKVVFWAEKWCCNQEKNPKLDFWNYMMRLYSSSRVSLHSNRYGGYLLQWEYWISKWNKWNFCSQMEIKKQNLR